MFERFTEQAIKVIMLAQEEARRLGQNFIGTEQILLGLIGESKSIAATVLKSQGIGLAEARVKVERIIGRGSGLVQVEIPFTERGKKVLEHALKQARHLGHKHISTEHLLLGLIQEPETVAVRVLQEYGVDITQLRTLILQEMGTKTIIKVDDNLDQILLLKSTHIDQKIDRLQTILAEAKEIISEVENWLQHTSSISAGELTSLINALGDSPRENQPGIKELLIQLLAAINRDSALESEDKKDAFEQIMVLVAIWQNPPNKIRQKTAKTALKILRATVAELPANSKLVADCQQILPAIADLFVPTRTIDDFSPFAKVLIQSGYVNPQQMRQALIETRNSQTPLIDVLQSLTGKQLSADLLREYKKNKLFELKLLYGVEAFDPEVLPIPLNQIRALIETIIPLDVCQRYSLLPLSKHDSQPPSILVAMVNPDDLEAHDQLAAILQRHSVWLQRMVVTEEDYQEILKILGNN